MLRRRIFSSAMASVMALSSVAVVANAEETAVANYKTKADLEAYVKSFDGFREDGLYDYGSASGEDFLNAIEYAENVIAEDGDNDKCTVAYDMLETTYKALKIYSAEELKVLIDSCKATYEKGNIYNEELNDEIYSADSFANFEAAYDEAESVLDSNDSRVITDTYETLKGAKDGLAAKDVITKAQFRAALKDYETMLSKEYANDTWRRGMFADGWVSSVRDWWKYQGQQTTYGAVYDFVEAWEGEIYAEYDRMDKIKTLSKTSDEIIVEAYKKCVDAPGLLGNWIADDTNRATKATVTKLLDEYHSLLVHDYAFDKAAALYNKIKEVVGPDKLFVEQSINAFSTSMEKTANKVAVGEEWVVDYATIDPVGDIAEAEKEIGATLNVKYEEGSYYIPVDDNGFYAPTEGVDVTLEKLDGVKYKTVNKKSVVNLAEFIKLDASMITTTPRTGAAAVTTPSEDLLEMIAAVPEADGATADATNMAKNFVASIEATGWFDRGDGEWRMGIGEAKAQLKGDAAKAANEAANKLAADYVAAVEAAAKAAYEILSGMEKITGATVAEIEADAAIYEAKAEATADVLGELNGLDKSYAYGALKDAMLEADADKGKDLNDAIGNVGETVGDIAVLVDEAYQIYADAAMAANNYGDAVEAEKEALKAERKATALLVKNADRNNIIDGGYTVENVNGFSVKANPGFVVNLKTAYNMADFYINTTDKAVIKADSPIYNISTTGAIVDGTATGSSAEWTLVYRYLKYALEDKYTVANGTHTKAEIVALIDEAYKLADDTGDAALFAANHDTLVDARNDAVNWVKEANKDKKYKDNYKPYAYGSGANNNKVATEVYNDLKGKYDALANDLAAFKYSFQDVHDQIAITEDMIDAGDLKATDALVKALNETAYNLSVVETIKTCDADWDHTNVTGEYADNDAFTSDRFWQGFNRVYTGGDGSGYKLKMVDNTELIICSAKSNGAPAGPNATHAKLQLSYEALLAEIKAQTEVTVLKGDVNGDGVVNAFDASALLKNIVNTVAMDAAVADYDANGVINALDASAILKAIVTA